MVDISQFREQEVECAKCGNKFIIKVSPRIKKITGKASACEKCRGS